MSNINLSNEAIISALNNKSDIDLQNAQLENIVDNVTIENNDGNLQAININSKKIIPAHKEYSFTKTNESGMFTSDILGYPFITNGTSCLLCTVDADENRFYYSTSGLENLSENNNYKTIDTTIITSEMVKEANPDADLTNFETGHYIQLLACNVVSDTYYVVGCLTYDYNYLFLLEIDSTNDFSINKAEIIGFLSSTDGKGTISIENNNIKIIFMHHTGISIYEKVDNVWTLTNTYNYGI